MKLARIIGCKNAYFFFNSSNIGNFQADEFLTTVLKYNQVFLMAKNAQNSRTHDSLILPLYSAILCNLWIMHQSIPPAPSLPPPGLTPGH